MLLIPLLAGFGVHAASIGAIDVSSHLGEPLQARVPIDLDGVSISGDDCVHIVGPARRHPVLSTAVVTLVSRDGHNFVSIVTDKPINDPLFDLSLRTYCGPSLQKDFVILLSPDSLTPAAAAVPAMVDITVPTVVADAVAPARPVRRATTPRASTPRRAAVAAPAARRHKAASISVLRLDYGHEAFGRQADGIAQTRLAEHPAEAANKPSTSDRLVLQAPTELPAGAGAMPPDQAGQSYRPQTEPAGTPTGPVAGNGGAIQAPAPAPVAPPWYARLSGIYLLLPLILLAGAGALWLIRRRPRSRFQNETLPDLNTLFPSEPETQPRHATLTLDLPDHEPPPVEPAPVQPARTRPMPTEAAPPPPSRLTTEAMEHMMGLGAPAGPAEEIQVEHQDSFDHVMELAEVMLAFGRSGQAIEALSRHIHANPRQSVDPWLKLLD
ncbi:MAG: hypothetical protein PHX10_11350, partial [Gallionellaceae bacterium]|nr:hypothetical protein [Gallionellaceae bacterium]